MFWKLGDKLTCKPLYCRKGRAEGESEVIFLRESANGYSLVVHEKDFEEHKKEIFSAKRLSRAFFLRLFSCKHAIDLPTKMLKSKDLKEEGLKYLL